VRSLRPHILPSHRKAYAALLKRGLDQYPHGRPIACFDLADQSIDAVGGRYYFSFIRDVIDAGFFPVFVAWRGTVSSFGSSRFKSLLLPEALGFVRSADEIPHPFIWITDARKCGQNRPRQLRSPHVLESRRASLSLFRSSQKSRIGKVIPWG
jgi:hypothetical protein